MNVITNQKNIYQVHIRFVVLPGNSLCVHYTKLYNNEVSVYYDCVHIDNYLEWLQVISTPKVSELKQVDKIR